MRINNASGTQIGKWDKDGISVSSGTINGASIILGGSNNTSGTLVIRNASGTQIGKWDKDGLSVTTGTISGDLITAGRISSNNGTVYFDLTNNQLVCSKITSVSSVLTVAGTTNIESIRTQSASTNYAYVNIYKIGNTGTSYSSAGFCITPPRTTSRNTSEYTYSFVDTSQITCKNGITLACGDIPADNMNTGDNFDTWLGLQYGGMWFECGTTGAQLIMNRSGSIQVYATRMSLYGDFNVVSGTKNRVVKTNDYGDRLLYCYETPSPLFGDVGEGIIAEDGKCYVMLDSIFAETVSLNQYQVFLQKYGDGDCWISERKTAYFVVKGTPGLAFGWELKAKQFDFDQLRLERSMDLLNLENNINYAQELINHINGIAKEREVA